jgi:Zn-dependent alcohol dehydrogenase
MVEDAMMHGKIQLAPFVTHTMGLEEHQPASAASI